VPLKLSSLPLSELPLAYANSYSSGTGNSSHEGKGSRSGTLTTRHSILVVISRWRNYYERRVLVQWHIVFLEKFLLSQLMKKQFIVAFANPVRGPTNPFPISTIHSSMASFVVDVLCERLAFNNRTCICEAVGSNGEMARIGSLDRFIRFMSSSHHYSVS